MVRIVRKNINHNVDLPPLPGGAFGGNDHDAIDDDPPPGRLRARRAALILPMASARPTGLGERTA